MNTVDFKALSGGCLCRGVRYRISGPCRHIILCHCENCRRTHGHIGAYTSVQQSDLQFNNQSSLQWYHDLSTDTWRGFCNCCGASLFWDAGNGDDKMAVAAGSLDDASDLIVLGHIFVSEAGKYYDIDDGRTQFEHGSEGAFELGQSG